MSLKYEPSLEVPRSASLGLPDCSQDDVLGVQIRHFAAEKILYDKGIIFKLSGNKVYYTERSFLVISK